MDMSRTIIDRTLASPLGEAAYKVVETLMDAGHEAYWVGGAIRDMACGTLPSEIDIATAALPKDVEKLFPRSDATHAALGAVVVSRAGHTFEVTTFREDDAASDGRHPESVRFGSLQSDAERRDATINALYFQPISREVIDPWSGLSDLAERLVRFIGDPETRIRHDVLRSLRMVRLRATIDGQYEPTTYAAIKKLASMTSSLSGTRVLQELEKLLASPRPWIGLEDLWELGILQVLVPELAATKGIAQPRQYHGEGDVWNHLLLCTKHFTLDHASDVRIAALLHDIGKVQTFSLRERIRFDLHAEVSANLATAVLRRMQVPRQRIEKIHWLIRHHMMMGSFATLSLERKAHWYYHPWFQELLQLFWLDAAGTTPQDFSLYDTIIADYDAFLNEHPRPKKPLLNGEEIMEILGLEPGPELGSIIAQLTTAQVHAGITKRSEAIDFLRSLPRST